jgi:hypothetical protein
MCVFGCSIEIADSNTPNSPAIAASAKINLLLPKDLQVFLEKNIT